MKWLSPLVLALAAAVLGKNWDDIPERWPIHWGLAGRPNGWATKSFLAVFGPLLLGAVIVVAFEVTARVARASASQRVDSGKQAKAAENAVHTVSLVVSLVLAGSAIWLPLVRPASPVGFIVFTVIVVAGGLIAAVVQTVRAQPPRDLAVPIDGEGWGVLFYRNPNDRRLWVPKRIGVGWTINFGHPMAWPMMLLLVVPPLVVVAVTVFRASGSH